MLNVVNLIRARNYAHASSVLRSVPFPLIAEADVRRLSDTPWKLGAKLVAKALEFMRTGRVAKADLLKEDARTVGVNELSTIWGVGMATAERLFNMGYTNVHKLRLVGWDLRDGDNLS